MSWKVEQRASFSLHLPPSLPLLRSLRVLLRNTESSSSSPLFVCFLMCIIHLFMGSSNRSKAQIKCFINVLSVVPDHEKMKTKSDCSPTPLQARWGRSTGLLVYCVGSFFYIQLSGPQMNETVELYLWGKYISPSTTTSRCRTDENIRTNRVKYCREKSCCLQNLINLGFARKSLVEEQQSNLQPVVITLTCRCGIEMIHFLFYFWVVNEVELLVLN